MNTYDRIGDGYDVTRRADRAIVAAFEELLELSGDGTYLDVACGTGNYTSRLAMIGGRWFAFDQSEAMLAQARPKSDAVVWSRHDVEQIGLESGFFDAAICSLAIHHFRDLARAFREVARVLKPAGRFVIFTSTPEQMNGYWLNEYFPGMMARSSEQMPSLEDVRRALPRGLVIRRTRPFVIEPDLEDFFLYSGKQRPEMYLSREVRDGISSFRNLCPEQELASGLASLAADIESGRIGTVMRRYDNEAGDYLFVVATKEA